MNDYIKNMGRDDNSCLPNIDLTSTKIFFPYGVMTEGIGDE